MKKLKAHLFICTQCTFLQTDGMESSPDVGASLRKNLKNKIKESPYCEEIKVTASGCLGKCDQGIASVLYPEENWQLGLRSDDEDNLYKKLINAALIKT